MTHQQDGQERQAIRSLLCDVAQLLDGWHQDGTAWTSWDESVRQRIAAALGEASAATKPAPDSAEWWKAIAQKLAIDYRDLSVSLEPRDGEQGRLREALEALIDACVTDGESAHTRVCVVCNYQWHRDDPAAGPDHGPDCPVKAAVQILTPPSVQPPGQGQKEKDR